MNDFPSTDPADILAEKKIFPTDLTTDELRALDAAVRNESFYSAQTLNEHLLELYRERIGAALRGEAPEGHATTELSQPYIRQSIKELLQESDYSPAAGEEGTLKDLSSDARINLILRTNEDLSMGQGLWMHNQHTALLDEWPGQELFRAEYREVPRDWLYRWRLAGAQTGDPIGRGWTITPDNRLIALKNHPIWNWIGSSALFKDALDVIWPPFAFNSGMWVRNVDRAETEAIGLLQKGQAAPRPMSIANALAAFAAKISALAQEVEK
ncbi:MAG: hypothetical protein KGL39_59190 [Patescibacteria group bacterium]|nr:hypothetical protein [Patescibacteria group bacterium]